MQLLDELESRPLPNQMTPVVLMSPSIYVHCLVACARREDVRLTHHGNHRGLPALQLQLLPGHPEWRRGQERLHSSGKHRMRPQLRTAQ